MNAYKCGLTVKNSDIYTCIITGNLTFLSHRVKQPVVHRSEQDVICVTNLNRLDMLSLLLTHGWVSSEHALMIAIERGYVPFLRYLVESRLDEYIRYSQARISCNSNAEKSREYFEKCKGSLSS